MNKYKKFIIIFTTRYDYGCQTHGFDTMDELLIKAKEVNEMENSEIEFMGEIKTEFKLEPIEVVKDYKLSEV